MDYIDVTCFHGPALRITIREVVCAYRSEYQHIAIYATYKFGKCLFLDGVIQCSEADQEIYNNAILKKLKPSDGRIVILGGGDGQIASKALFINPNLNITIVELDEQVVNASRAHLNQNIFNDHRVEVVIDDAFKFLSHSTANFYDGVLFDLTDTPIVSSDEGNEGLMCSGLNQSKLVLKKHGWLSLYAGCNSAYADHLVDCLKAHRTEKEMAHIPCFGEPCFFVHSQVRNG